MYRGFQISSISSSRTRLSSRPTSLWESVHWKYARRVRVRATSSLLTTFKDPTCEKYDLAGGDSRKGSISHTALAAVYLTLDLNLLHTVLGAEDLCHTYALPLDSGMHLHLVGVESVMAGSQRALSGMMIVLTS